MKWTIYEGEDSVALSNSTVGIETEVIDITVPDVYRYVVSQTTLMDLTLKTAGGVDISDDAVIKIYLARPDKQDEKFLTRFAYREVKNSDPYDRRKAFYLEMPQAISLPERWHLIVKVNDSAVAVDKTKTLLLFYVEKVQE